jgi:Acetyltransferase (GNAT) domain
VEQYQIRLYQNEDFALWNDFISKAKNATFLFHRNFMEYHKDRFVDYSLMIFQEEKLVAVLPANRVEDTVYSHQGLTYGGLVFSMKSKANDENEIVNQLVSFLKSNSVKEFIFKQLPIFYFLKVSNEMDYFLFQKGAKLYRKDMNLAINLTLPLHISKSKLKHFNKVDEDLKMVEETDFSAFWEKVLQPRLAEKHATKPVHNAEEIHRLKSSFPNNIKQFSAYYEGEIVAGITIFDSNLVVKSQYGATTSKGEELRALDFLFITLIQKYQSEGKHYFDMGIVNENEGRDFNKGLLNQKEELGCEVYNQDYYKWTFND